VTIPTLSTAARSEAAAADPAGASTGSGFRLVSDRPVPLLGLNLQHYRHPSGAEHFHLANEDEHRAFNVAFRTLPDDSTGLPHILEHLALCGSDRYPVRDPFFMMIRRSLNTFMNAMTGSDMTYYPFASQVEKDFFNLLSIYLDATFAPRLEALDFAQEGWRLEPKDAAQRDPAPADWEFKGVVYNEMKGARGNTDALVFEAMGASLAPDTPYRFDSGGDPEVIPELVHADLVDFHARHYAAANACFVTYGRLDPLDLQSRFAPYLAARPGEPIALPPLQPRLDEAQTVDVPVPLEAGQDPRDVSLVRLAWLWGDSSSLRESLLGELLDMLLLGHAAAPLRLALESSGLGRALAWSGFHGIGRNGLFSAGLKGVDPKDYEALPPLVLGVLEEIAGDGFAEGEVEAALHQLELGRRNISGDRFPFGLELAMRTVEAWRTGEDALGFLDMESDLEALRQDALAPAFWQSLIRERLLDNPHRVFLRAQPDPNFNQAQNDAEKARLDARVAALDEKQRAGLLLATANLAARQAQIDDASVLPDLELSDVPAVLRWAEPEAAAPGLTRFDLGTNGILHQVVALPLGGLDAEEVMLLPLLTRAIGELGVGKRDYRQQAARLNALCGGIGAWSDLRGHADELGRMQGWLFLEVSGLARRESEWAGLLAETLRQQRFDEQDRLRELLEQSLAGLQQRVNHSGHEMAQTAAARGFGGAAGLSHELGGLGRLAWLKAFERGARADASSIAALGQRLEALLIKIRQAPLRLALIGDAVAEPAVLANLDRAWEGFERQTGAAGSDSEASAGAGVGVGAGVAAIPAPSAFDTRPLAYTTATQVNYCALAFPTVPHAHPDSAALAVAARYLSNNFLHGRLREQGGAYGGRAGFGGKSGLFGITSYRDPRLAATFADMREGLRWMTTAEDDPRLLKEAILGVIGGMDRPASPSGEGRKRFVADLFDFGPERINDYRQRVLATRSEDLRRVTADWLPADGGSSAVITSEAMIAASGLDWEREAI
jgi:Zn-dependent M16 (insulinase) family peptidase